MSGLLLLPVVLTADIGYRGQNAGDEAFRKEADFIIDNSGVLMDSYRQIDKKLEAFTWQE